MSDHVIKSEQSSITLDSRGAVFIEAAIGFGVLIFILLGIIEFARYATFNAVLQASADEALALAQTVPDLDSTDQNRREGGGGYKGAKPAIREVATRIATKTFFSVGGSKFPLTILDTTNGSPVRISMKEPTSSADSDEARRKLLEENPITIELEAKVPLMLGKLLYGSELTVRASAIGFREPRNPFAEPAPLDCKGNPLPPNTPQPTDCVCPTDSANPAVAYNPSLSKCVCTQPASIFVAAKGITTGAEWGLNYDAATKSCQCPAPYVMNSNGKCECGLTDTSCESAYHSWDANKTPFGAGAHVRTWDFYFATCECQTPCTKAGQTSLWGVAPSSWDANDQRCECTPPTDIQGTCQAAWESTYPNSPYSGNWAVTESCECRRCGQGTQLDLSRVMTERYTFGCDCSTAPACPAGADRPAWNGCTCMCGNGADFMKLPDGRVVCGATGCSGGRSCYLDSATGEIKVCEGGGLCANSLPYVPAP